MTLPMVEADAAAAPPQRQAESTANGSRPGARDGWTVCVIRFAHRQVEEVSAGGWAVLRRKLWRAIREGVLLVPAVMLVVGVRLLRPWRLIRFGWIRSDRIGHLALDTELYLCEQDAGMHPRDAMDLFYFQFPVSNGQLGKMFRRLMRIGRWVRPLEEWNRRLPGGAPHQIVIRGRELHGSRDLDRLLDRTPAHLSFTPEEERRGREALVRLGVSAGARVVCFHARDAAYLSTTFPKRDWRYHDYRNSSIRSYVPAAEALVRRGYVAIRMGAVVREALPSTHPHLIDYATVGRTEFLDIYLSATCQFFIGTGTGIDAVASIFRRPMVYVNFVPIERVHAWSQQELFIPKTLWSVADHRLLTFRETLESGAGRFMCSAQYAQAGLEVIDNSPEEITAVVTEMDERLRATWVSHAEDEEFQRRFWALYQPGQFNRVFVSRIGTEFLRQHRELLT